MLLSWSFAMIIHAIVATAAITLGGFNLARLKRGDRLHKIVGRAWVILMLVTSVSAFFIGGYDSVLSIALHALAAWTIISIISGVYFARKGNISAHKGFMIGSYLGLIGAFMGVVVVPDRRVPTWFDAYPLQMMAIALIIIALTWTFIYIASRRVTKPKKSK